MAAGPVGSGICLKHDKVWRSKFQSYMNNISGPARRNPLIGPSDIKKITKAVCICNQDVNQKWSQISNNLAEAHRVFQQNFMRSAIHDISRQSLKELYEHFRSNNMFTGSGSADRLIFIFMVKEGHITTTSDILNNICPTSRNQSRATNVHLGSLRRSHIGRFIGRGGTGIREAVHGIPVGNIALNFINENEGHVEVRATYSCRRRNGPRIRAALDHRLRFYQNEVPIPVRFRERFNPSTVRPETQEEANCSCFQSYGCKILRKLPRVKRGEVYQNPWLAKGEEGRTVSEPLAREDAPRFKRVT